MAHPRKYHVLLQWHPTLAKWCIEFGAYDRADVIGERLEYRDQGIRADYLHVMTVATSDNTQATIDALVAAFNGQRLPVH